MSVPPEDEPAPLSRAVTDSRDGVTVAVALGIVAFIVVGVLKPWTLIASPSPSAPEPTATVATSNPPASPVAASPLPPAAGWQFAGLIGWPPAPIPGIANGWVAFSSSDKGGIYLVGEGTPAHRITQTEDGSIVQACPAFSPDGRRLAFGQASGTFEGGYHDASLVIADLTPVGDIASSVSIPLHGVLKLPCGVWSPDGRWIALGVETGAYVPGKLAADEVWLVDAEGYTLRRLSGLAATDLKWSPDGRQLAIAHGVLSLYSVATDDLTPVGRNNAVGRLSWSPDGTHIAYERTAVALPTGTGVCADGACETGSEQLWIIGADGSGDRLVASGYSAFHGVGPVWSPDGRLIAYMRACYLCGEGHDVVLVSVGAGGPGLGTLAPVVLPRLRTQPSGPIWWPYSVTWSPDGTHLLYHAWSEGVDTGLVDVPIDGTSPAVVLYEEGRGTLGSIAVNAGSPWLPFQVWGRRNGPASEAPSDGQAPAANVSPGPPMGPARGMLNVSVGNAGAAFGGVTCRRLGDGRLSIVSGLVDGDGIALVIGANGTVSSLSGAIRGVVWRAARPAQGTLNADRSGTFSGTDSVSGADVAGTFKCG